MHMILNCVELAINCAKLTRELIRIIVILNGVEKRTVVQQLVSELNLNPVDKVIQEFLAKVKIGPDYVCTCCHRMLYRHAVIGFKPTKYTKASPELLRELSEHAYITSDGKQWVCKTCDGALCRGNLPVQAKANGMELGSEPAELSCLNASRAKVDIIACTLHEDGSTA